MNTRPDPDNFVLRLRGGAAAAQGEVMTEDRMRGASLARILSQMTRVDAGALREAVAAGQQFDVPVPQALLSRGAVDETALIRALSVQYDCDIIDLDRAPPDPRMVFAVGIDWCLRQGVLPWRMVGATPVLITAHPERFDDDRAHLPPQFQNAMMALAPPGKIAATLASLGCMHLAKRAETRTDAELSSRDFNPSSLGRACVVLVTSLALLALIAPGLTLAALTLFAAAVLAVLTALKFAALFAALTKRPAPDGRFVSARGRDVEAAPWPTVSLLIPLYREKSIAARLIRRLGRLNYPRELLDICLIVEENDRLTRQALESRPLAANMRVITVPYGKLKTKPRALNYALDFARGSIIGVLDAEDAPAPDQITKAVARFRDAPPRVACLQGALDFYNPGTNFLSRAFTLEYASWFRVMLPGLERLGLVVPLGGTTLYLRRDALEEIGGWDAHNVTEDADLGIRLARMGYRTELFDTVTLEEANCRLWPWVKQRSRWLKGYAMTWAVHMRAPRRLWAELGPWRFFGVQALFLGTILHFLTLPLLLSFWALPLGLPHPLTDALPGPIWTALVGCFIATEIATLAIAATGARLAGHRRLWAWIPLLHLYFPLAAIACYRAIYEMARRPFYWAKTEHGVCAAPPKRARGIRPALLRRASGASQTPG